MSTALIHDIITLCNQGWRPYTGTVLLDVYRQLQCVSLADVLESDTTQSSLLPVSSPKRRTSRKKYIPYWFYRADTYLCMGCARRCSLVRPVGFQLPLPLRYVTTGLEYTLSPQEMVSKLCQLTAGQAAYCLNISKPQVYHWIREGKLTRSKGNPLRIPVAAVRALLSDIDQ
ncbi:MAG: helix-turn-helix domain-containing protein [Desulfovibrionaceae bacterium]